VESGCSRISPRAPRSGTPALQWRGVVNRCHYVFVRFRQSRTRVQASLIETRRVADKVKHEHLASLGAVGVPTSPADRITFWMKLHQRLAALTNRVGREAQGAILTAVHARIPMPTQDDQRAVALENAKADVRFWDTMRGMHADRADGNKGLASKLARNIADDETAAANAAAEGKAAAERLAKVERGEAAPGVGKPMSAKDLRKALGMSVAEVRHCMRLAEAGEAAIPEIIDAGQRAQKRAEYAAVRAILLRA
jgi:hypothetical protein